MNLFLNQLRWGCGQTKKIQEELDRLRTETLRTFAELILGRKIFEGGKEND